MRPAGRSKHRLLFFETTTGGRQVRRINQSHGLFPTGGLRNEILAQAVVDLAQPADTYPGAKFMEHAHIGQLSLVGQVGKVAPAALFRQ